MSGSQHTAPPEMKTKSKARPTTSAASYPLANTKPPARPDASRRRPAFRNHRDYIAWLTKPKEAQETRRMLASLRDPAVCRYRSCALVRAGGSLTRGDASATGAAGPQSDMSGAGGVPRGAGSVEEGKPRADKKSK